MSLFMGPWMMNRLKMSILVENDQLIKWERKKKNASKIRAYPYRFIMLSAVMLNMWCLPQPIYGYKATLMQCWPNFETYPRAPKRRARAPRMESQSPTLKRRAESREHQLGEPSTPKIRAESREHQTGKPGTPQESQEHRIGEPSTPKIRAKSREHQTGKPATP